MAAVIKTEFDITMHPAAVSKMLKRIGLTSQRPVRKAWQQDEKKVREYLDMRYPALRKQAEDSGAIIYFIDEGGIRSDYHSGTNRGRQGYTPTVVKTGARFGINMIAAVSGDGHMRYMTIPGRFNADVFIKFLRQIVNSHDCPVIIVTDGHSAHPEFVSQIHWLMAAGRRQTQAAVRLRAKDSYSTNVCFWALIEQIRLGKNLATSSSVQMLNKKL